MSSILQFDLIIALYATAALSTVLQLQGQSINLVEAAKESKVIIGVLREERNDQTFFE